MKTFNYNIEYWDKMLRQNTSTAEKINKIRWNFVKSIKPKIVLDFGAGVGWFRAFAPKEIEVDTFDIANWPQTGIRHKKYDLITFWDVLEHIPDFHVIEPFLISVKYVAISLPILPEDGNMVNWRHYKPLEHLHYFDKEMLRIFFKAFNFKLIKDGSLECCIRKDIYTALFKKINKKI